MGKRRGECRRSSAGQRAGLLQPGGGALPAKPGRHAERAQHGAARQSSAAGAAARSSTVPGAAWYRMPSRCQDVLHGVRQVLLHQNAKPLGGRLAAPRGAGRAGGGGVVQVGGAGPGRATQGLDAPVGHPRTQAASTQPVARYASRHSQPELQVDDILRRGVDLCQCALLHRRPCAAGGTGSGEEEGAVPPCSPLRAMRSCHHARLARPSQHGRREPGGSCSRQPASAALQPGLPGCSGGLPGRALHCAVDVQVGPARERGQAGVGCVVDRPARVAHHRQLQRLARAAGHSACRTGGAGESGRGAVLRQAAVCPRVSVSPRRRACGCSACSAGRRHPLASSAGPPSVPFP